MPETVAITIADDDIKLLTKALQEAGVMPATGVPDLARKVVRAGSQEALAYASGRSVPTTVAEMHSYRVYTLLKENLDLETAEEVLPALLKVTPTSARSFMRSAVARFAGDLEEQVKKGVKRNLTVIAKNWDPDTSRWAVTIRSTIVRDWIFGQLRLARMPMPDPTSAHRGAMLLFPEETLDYLRGLVGLNPLKPPERNKRA